MMKKVISFLKKRWVLVVIIAGVGGFVWYRQTPKEPEYKEYTVVQDSITEVLEVSGELAASKSASLKFQAGGRLSWVGVSEGERVKKWQSIASLDTRTLQKSLEKELSEYMTERWNFEDTRDDYEITSDDLDSYTLSEAARRVLERSQFSLNRTVLDVEIQAVTKEYALLFSPIDGIVSALHTKHPGVNVAVTDKIAEIVDPDTMYFSAEIDELDIGKVKVGQQVDIILDAYPDETLSSTIVEIGFSPLTLSGGGIGYEVKIALPVSNAGLKYRMGMNGDAYIILHENPDALVLPIEAVIEKEDGVYVKRQVAGTVTEEKVETGIETDDTVEILTGLIQGDVVVTSENK